MAQFASDTFTGTSGTELSAYSASWTRHTAASTTGINTVISDAARARGSASGGSSVYTHSGSPAGANYSVSCDLVFKEADGGTDGYTGVIGRADTTAATFYMFRYAGSTVDGWQLYISNGGSFSQLGTTATATVADEATKAIELRMVSDQISGYVAGVLTIGPETNAVISPAGKSGTRITNSNTNTTGIHIDNFSADDIASTTTIDLTAASFGFTANAQQNTLRGSLSVSTFTMTAQDTQNRQTIAPTTASLTFTANTLANRLTASLTAATQTFTAYAIQNRLTIGLSAAALGFTAWAVTFNGIFAAITARLMTLLGVGS